MKTLIKVCGCDVHDMDPVKTYTTTFFTTKCSTCGGSISHRQLDGYNQYWGYSGYDEYNDEPSETN